MTAFTDVLDCQVLGNPIFRYDWPPESRVLKTHQQLRLYFSENYWQVRPV